MMVWVGLGLWRREADRFRRCLRGRGGIGKTWRMMAMVVRETRESGQGTWLRFLVCIPCRFWIVATESTQDRLERTSIIMEYELPKRVCQVLG